MNKKLPIFFILFIILSFSSLIFFPQSAHASILNDIVNGIKNIISPTPQQHLSITSKVVLAADGDLNHDGKIDAGDFVTFTFKITNPTNSTYSSTTIKTNVKRSEFNLIHNVQGTLNLDYLHNDTIAIPYFNIGPNQVRTVSFDAHINFFKDEDVLLSTEPELLDSKNGSLVKGSKEEFTANKMDIGRFNEFVHITKQ